MLQNTPPRLQTKNIQLRIDNYSLYELLKALLLEWGYHLTDNPEKYPLLIFSEMLMLPDGYQHILTLGTSPSEEQCRLKIPFKLEALFLILENHFHRVQRRHMRINLEWPIRVSVRGLQFETSTQTLSDCGMRFISPLELAPKERMEIHIERGGETYDLHTQVIYLIRNSEIGRGEQFEVGVVCTPQSKEVSTSIRNRIIGHYLTRVRERLDHRLFAEGLQQLNLPPLSTTLLNTEPLARVPTCK